MTILIDLWHPGHYHLLKNAAKRLEALGSRIVWTIKPKDILIDLLNNEGIEFTIVSRTKKTNKFSLAKQLFTHTLGVYKIAKKTNSKTLIGTSASIGWASKMLGAKSIVFNEDDADVVPLFSKLAYPAATFIIKPDCLSFENGKNDIYHNSYHELAYLHPDLFTPDKKILEGYGLKPYRYSMFRFSSFKAHHDKHALGIPAKTKAQINEVLSSEGEVIESQEGQLEKKYNINPSDMHNILAFARILVSDSQTMTAEAAVLGVPAIRYNSFVGRISYLEELEHNYKLTFGFRPGQESKMSKKIEESLSKKGLLQEEWQRKRQTMLKNKINMTEWIVEFIKSQMK